MRYLVADGFHGSNDIFIQGRMTRLENRCIVFLPPNKYFSRIYLSDIKDCVDRNFDFFNLMIEDGRLL